jgi:site-specific DNA recombinase
MWGLIQHTFFASTAISSKGFAVQNQFAAPPGSRAVIYLRVSTGKQAQKDLSIPDQRKQLRAHCKHNAYNIVEEFKDAKSGTTDKRPGFQAMVDAILYGGLECELIVVHSFSRFFRDQVIGELYIRSLAKRGVRVVSLTQHTDESPEGHLMRRILAIFDEYQSLETAKHVRRSLHENALQGLWNGGNTPFGYRVVEIERRGKTRKKGLAIDERDATVVRLMFDLALKGDGSSGPMGIKAIVCWLNERGYRTRRGKKWGVSGIHRHLINRTYTGDHIFRSGENGGVEIPLQVPAIVSEEEFLRLRDFLDARNPKKTPPRVVTGDVLLTGLVTCPHCGDGMTTQTGKGGRYRYYSCSNNMRTGKTGCRGHRVRMDALDDLVLQRVRGDLLTSEKMNAQFDPLRSRQEKAAEDQAERLASRDAEVQIAKRSLDALYGLVQQGLVDLTEEDFKKRFLEAKEKHLRVKRERDQVAAELTPDAHVSHQKVSEFVSGMQESLAQTSIVGKRGFLRAIIDEIRVGEDQITIVGRRSLLERAIVSGDMVASPVPTFVRKWRGDRDSNPGNALTFNGFQDRRIRPLCHLPGLMAV